MRSNKRFSDKTVIVTGAAQGIGKRVAADGIPHVPAVPTDSGARLGTPYAPRVAAHHGSQSLRLTFARRLANPRRQ